METPAIRKNNEEQSKACATNEAIVSAEASNL